MGQLLRPLDLFFLWVYIACICFQFISLLLCLKSFKVGHLSNKLSLAKIGSKKLSSKIWLRFVLLRKAFQLGLAQRSSAFKINHYSDLFYSGKIWSKFWTSILIMKVQRTFMSFKSSFGALEDAGGSWLGFGILIMIWIWSLVFCTPMIRNLGLYLDFLGTKSFHVL